MWEYGHLNGIKMEEIKVGNIQDMEQITKSMITTWITMNLWIMKLQG
jgi:hypothetical protein